MEEKRSLLLVIRSPLVYDFLDENIDAGTTHVAATEIRMKLKSHQAALAVSSDSNAHTLDWHVTDSASSCQRINQAIYAETLKLVEPRRLEFFTKYGLPIVFDEDFVGAVPAGPLWIYNPLKTQVKVSSGPTGSPSYKALHVTSNGFVTSLDTVFGKISSYVPGFHYCKLISPAFVMEWIYTDSVRDKLGWGSTVVYHLQPFT